MKTLDGIWTESKDRIIYQTFLMKDIDGNIRVELVNLGYDVSDQTYCYSLGIINEWCNWRANLSEDKVFEEVEKYLESRGFDFLNKEQANFI